MGVRRAGPGEGRSQAPGTRGDLEHPQGLSRLSLDDTFALIATVPSKVVLGIFGRYGKPLAVPMPPAADDDQRAALTLPDGAEASVRVLQVRGLVDVIPNDFFVLERSGQDPLAVEGPLFAAALEALARAAGYF